MENEVMVPETIQGSLSAQGFFDPAWYSHALQIAEVFATSTLVPEHFKNKSNCLIALNLAARIGCDPLALMQNMYVVHGKPGLEAKMAIALINASGRFTPLKYEFSGQGDAYQCIAYATEKASGERVDGPAVSIAMAKSYGWYGKKDSHWPKAPVLMLTYRAATFFGRIHSPEALLGMHTKEELIDMGEVSPGVYAPSAKIDIAAGLEKAALEASRQSLKDDANALGPKGKKEFREVIKTEFGGAKIETFSLDQLSRGRELLEIVRLDDGPPPMEVGQKEGDAT